MSSCQLMFPGVRSFLVFSSFGFNPPASGFLILTVASRLLHPYSTNDNTSRLIMKRFSIIRDTQRGLQGYMKKSRGRREIEVARRKRGGIKRGEHNLASNQFPMCSHTHSSQSYIERRKGRKEIEVSRSRKRGIQEKTNRSRQYSVL